MRLNHLHLRHFRSLFDVQLDLKPLTIIIGSNASGKSNLFKALRFLYDGVAGDRLEWQAYDSQIDELVWYGLDDYGNRPGTLDFECLFGTAFKSLAQYNLTIACNDYLTVNKEQLAISIPDHKGFSPYYSRDRKQLRQYIGKRGKRLAQPDRLKARSDRTLSLRDEGPDLHLPLAQALYQHIVGWRFFNVNLQKAREEAFVPPVPDSLPPLANDASNLSAFLYALWQLHPDDFDTIVKFLSDFVELPESIMVEHDAERGGKNARYSFLERPFGESHPVPAQSMSDGTIRLLAHLALLMGDRHATLACLEEPDHGLHPRMMACLADILRQTAGTEDDQEATPVSQVIVTTHSPEFMDCFDLEAEKAYLQVYIAERDETGKTVLVPSTAREFAPWLEKYRLGEAVRRHFV